MTSTPFFQVDAFAVRPLTGNPAAVMPLEHWLEDSKLQAIAAENNLSETAFTVPSDRDDADYELRWFTPAVEVPLCGHATLAAGHVMMSREEVRFSTRSGILTVRRVDDLLELDVPANPVASGEVPGLAEALGVSGDVFVGRGVAMIRLTDEAQVRSVAPDFAALKSLPDLVVVTAPGDEHSVASRVFAVPVGIDEDPVTGAAHAAIAPYWAAELGRDEFSAVQASARGGRLHCRVVGDRVRLGGQCFTVIAGSFQL